MVFQLCIFLFCIVYDLLLLLLQVMLQVWRINITFIIFSIILSQWIYLFFFFSSYSQISHILHHLVYLGIIEEKEVDQVVTGSKRVKLHVCYL